MNRKEYVKQYYLLNKDKIKECQKQYRSKNRDRMKEYRKQYYIDNKEKMNRHIKQYYLLNRDKKKKYAKQYRFENRDKIKEQRKQYLIDNKEKIRKGAKQYLINNKQKINIYMYNRYHNDIQYKLAVCLRDRIYKALNKNIKSKPTLKLLDCSVKELKLWLESQFTKGMTWDNYGRDGWSIDHVYPCSKFNLEQPYEQKICFNWFNLQPMWSEDNMSKSAKLNINIK